MKVLVVVDESRLAAELTRGLRAEGYEVATVRNGLDALWEITENHFDAIILDVLLSGLSGYEVLRRVRAAQVWTPVLMLAGKDGDCVQAAAFDLGADDFVAKPFS